jgi:hypothetical protein
MTTPERKQSTSALLSKKELLDIVVNERVAGFLPGEWESRKPGSGYEFDGLREMQPGDLSPVPENFMFANSWLKATIT